MAHLSIKGWHHRVQEHWGMSGLINSIRPGLAACSGVRGIFSRGHPPKLNSFRPRQNGRLFADDTFKRIFLNENIRISIKNSLKFVPKGLINNIPALVLIMAWRRPGYKPLSEPMLVRSLMHICVTRPQWVNSEGSGVVWVTGLFSLWNKNVHSRHLKQRKYQNICSSDFIDIYSISLSVLVGGNVWLCWLIKVY